VAGQLIETPRGCKIPVPGDAYLDGRDFDAEPPLTVGRINLFNQPDSSYARYCLRHGTRVNVLEMQRHGDIMWFYVRNGRRQGWVRWMFVNSEKHEPIGDVIG
jgi:hypothetical protein